MHKAGCLTVWATSWFATISDLDGNEFPPGSRETARVVGGGPDEDAATATATAAGPGVVSQG